MDKKNVPTHAQVKALYEVVITPEHKNRTESSEFKKSKKRLKSDGHYQCYICGTKDELQVHHYAAEWSLENLIDYDKLKQFCEEWDIYGYGKLLKKLPMTTVDDIRNMMVLCQDHHTGLGDLTKSGTGVHSLSFNLWIIQKLAKENPIPQDNETIEETIEDINKLISDKDT